MWLFVTLWTFVLTTAIYMLAGVWILVVFGKSKLAWVVVPLFVLFGATTALLAGGIVGTPERGAGGQRAQAQQRSHQAAAVLWARA